MSELFPEIRPDAASPGGNSRNEISRGVSPPAENSSAPTELFPSDISDRELAQLLAESLAHENAGGVPAFDVNVKTPLLSPLVLARLRRVQECIQRVETAARADRNASAENSAPTGILAAEHHGTAIPKIPSSAPLRIDGIIDSARFVIRRWLGDGGMGTVYEAFDRDRNELVALKTMNRNDSAAQYNFKREFRTLADVRHRSLARLYEMFSVDGQLFFTMERIDGVDLRSYLGRVDPAFDASERTGRLVPGTAAWIEAIRDVFEQLSTGLVALHQAGKLHRDIKPSNVLVTREGRPILLDFGLTKEFDRAGTGSNTEVRIVGTMAYMSPEQAAGRSLTPASDWYSVGVMLYQVLTGQLPCVNDANFEAACTAEHVLITQGSTDPEAESIGESHAVVAARLFEVLRRVCLDLLNPHPDQRPTGHEVLHRLGKIPQPAWKRSATIASTSTSTFVGREQPLETLRAVFQQMRRGVAALVEIHGRSGIGKSALVEHFLLGLTDEPRVVALKGRCYERESVPHKTLDSLVDALSHFLRKRSRLEGEALLPRDVASLLKLFPVPPPDSTNSPPRSTSSTSSS